MVSKLTAGGGKHMFEAIMRPVFQLPPIIQPTKAQSSKTTHQGEVPLHNFLYRVLNYCHIWEGNECLAFSEHVQKEEIPSRLPLATFQAVQVSDGGHEVKVCPEPPRKASFLLRSFPFDTLQSLMLTFNFFHFEIVRNPFTSKNVNSNKEQTVTVSPIPAAQSSPRGYCCCFHLTFRRQSRNSPPCIWVQSHPLFLECR